MEECLKNSTFRKTGEGKSIPKRQRPTEVNTVFLSFQVVPAELRVLQHRPKNPKSETMTSTPDDAELVKDLRDVGKPHLFDGNDDVSFFPVSEDDSILFRVAWMTWWIRVQMNTREPSERWTTR